MVRLGRCATDLVEGGGRAVADRTREGPTRGEGKERGQKEGTSGEEERGSSAGSIARDLIQSSDRNRHTRYYFAIFENPTLTKQHSVHPETIFVSILFFLCSFGRKNTLDFYNSIDLQYRANLYGIVL